MMKKKQIVDIAMVAALPFLMTYELIGEATHEILGIAMLALVVAHHLLNRSWHTHLLRGKYTPQRAVMTAMDALLFVLLILQAVSGIMMAKHTFGFLPHVGRRSIARTIHMTGAYWNFALMCVHAGFHMLPLCVQAAKATRMAKDHRCLGADCGMRRVCAGQAPAPRLHVHADSVRFFRL
ncbi:MAG: DUF4405 domain-containing protein [Christensenellales bacterium]